MRELSYLSYCVRGSPCLKIAFVHPAEPRQTPSKPAAATRRKRRLDLVRRGVLIVLAGVIGVCIVPKSVMPRLLRAIEASRDSEEELVRVTKTGSICPSIRRASCLCS